MARNRIVRHVRVAAKDLVPHELNPRTHSEAQRLISDRKHPPRHRLLITYRLSHSPVPKIAMLSHFVHIKIRRGEIRATIWWVTVVHDCQEVQSLFSVCSMTCNGSNTTGFPSPATIYLEAVIDLAAILDLRKPSRYPVRVMGGSLPARGIADKDILVVDCALDRAPDRVCVAMGAGEVFLAVLKRTGPTWHLVRAAGDEIEITEDLEVWGIVTSIVRQAL
jgi:DNA polymerase V